MITTDKSIVNGSIQTVTTNVTTTMTTKEELIARMTSRANIIATMTTNLAAKQAEQDSDTTDLTSIS